MLQKKSIQHHATVLLVSVLFLLASGTFGFAVSASAAPIELKFGTGSMSKDVLGKFDLQWIKQLEERSNGKVKVTWFGDGIMGSSKQSLDLLLGGTYDITEFGTAIRPGRFTLVDVATLPYIAPNIFPATLALQALYEQDKDVQAEFNDIKVLFLGTKIAYQILTVEKPIKTIDDIKGLKINVFGEPYALIVKALGGVPVLQPPPDVYSSLDRGILDGAMVHFNLAYAFKLAEVCKYATKLDIARSCGLQCMNLKKWNSLPPDIQKAIMDISGSNGALALATAYDTAESDLIQNLKASGLTIIDVAPQEKQKIKAAVLPLWEKWANNLESKGKPGKRVLETFQQLQKKYTK